MGWKFTVRQPDATVWLGNLPEGLTKEELQEHMSQAGEVKRAQLTSGNSGFCLFAKPEEAQAALSALNGSILKGQSILVDPWTRKDGGEAKAPEANGSGGKKKGAKKQQSVTQGVLLPVGLIQPGLILPGTLSAVSPAPGASAAGAPKAKKARFEVKEQGNPEATVWLGNLPAGLNVTDLTAHLAQVGETQMVKITHGKTGFAWFKEPEMAKNAIAMLNGSDLKGNAIVVDTWTKREYPPKKKAAAADTAADGAGAAAAAAAAAEPAPLA